MSKSSHSTAAPPTLPPILPPNVRLIERGWLSANTVLIADVHSATAIDTGYVSHAAQTLSLLGAALGAQRLDRIINTHLHSDHCGGDAALVAQYGCDVLIPPGEAVAVAAWDTAALSYDATGQQCPRFSYTGLIQAGDVMHLGGSQWQVLAAAGHDPNSVMLYCEQYACLISADALWENGFGVVFPELDGVHAFDAVAATLDVIAGLNITAVLPGHGAVFTDASGALERAYSRLNSFVQNPVKHRWHAVKVLCMFYLMAQPSTPQSRAISHLSSTRYIAQVAQQLGGSTVQVVQQALDEMVVKEQLRITASCYHVV